MAANRISFTDERIRKLPVPEHGRPAVFDDKIPPLCVRLSPSGRRAFYIYKRVDGMPTFVKVGDFPEMKTHAAREQGEIILGDLRKGINPTEEKRRKNHAETLGDLWDEYRIRHLEAKGKSTAQAEHLWKRNLYPLRNRKLYSIKSRDIVELYDRILDRGSPQVANKIHGLLSAMYRHGLKRAFPGLDFNPVSGRELPAPKSVKTRVLSPDEIKMFWSNLDNTAMSLQARQALRVCLTTMQRPGEVAGMTWAELDLDNREWTIPRERTKNSRAHLVPLSDLAVEILDSMPREADYVFPGARAGTRIGASTLPNALRVGYLEGHFPECERFTPHDLRRTGATLVRNPRITEEMVGMLLNHTSQTVTGKHYSLHDGAEEKKHVAQAWERKLRDILNPPESNVVRLTKYKS